MSSTIKQHVTEINSLICFLCKFATLASVDTLTIQAVASAFIASETSFQQQYHQTDAPSSSTSSSVNGNNTTQGSTGSGSSSIFTPQVIARLLEELAKGQEEFDSSVHGTRRNNAYTPSSPAEITELPRQYAVYRNVMIREAEKLTLCLRTIFQIILAYTADDAPKTVNKMSLRNLLTPHLVHLMDHLRLVTILCPLSASVVVSLGKTMQERLITSCQQVMGMICEILMVLKSVVQLVVAKKRRSRDGSNFHDDGHNHQQQVQHHQENDDKSGLSKAKNAFRKAMLATTKTFGKSTGKFYNSKNRDQQYEDFAYAGLDEAVAELKRLGPLVVKTIHVFLDRVVNTAHLHRLKSSDGLIASMNSEVSSATSFGSDSNIEGPNDFNHAGKLLRRASISSMNSSSSSSGSSSSPVQLLRATFFENAKRHQTLETAQHDFSDDQAFSSLYPSLVSSQEQQLKINQESQKYFPDLPPLVPRNGTIPMNTAHSKSLDNRKPSYNYYDNEGPSSRKSSLPAYTSMNFPMPEHEKTLPMPPASAPIISFPEPTNSASSSTSSSSSPARAAEQTILFPTTLSTQVSLQWEPKISDMHIQNMTKGMGKTAFLFGSSTTVSNTSTTSITPSSPMLQMMTPLIVYLNGSSSTTLSLSWAKSHFKRGYTGWKDVILELHYFDPNNEEDMNMNAEGDRIAYDVDGRELIPEIRVYRMRNVFVEEEQSMGRLAKFMSMFRDGHTSSQPKSMPKTSSPNSSSTTFSHGSKSVETIVIKELLETFSLKHATIREAKNLVNGQYDLAIQLRLMNGFSVMIGMESRECMRYWMGLLDMAIDKATKRRQGSIRAYPQQQGMVEVTGMRRQRSLSM